MGLLSLFSIAALGNLTGQDLGQRIFSAKSAKVAKWACLIAGILYIIIGSIPVWFGLTTELTLGDNLQGNIISLLINKYLDGFTAIVLLLAIISAVVSTITSALLAPASIMANNYLKNIFKDTSQLLLCRLSVIIIAISSIVVALLGDNVYGLLEDSYAIGFVGFFPALVIGLYGKILNEKAMLVTILIATIIWIPSFFINTEVSFELIAVVVSFPLYYALNFFFQLKDK
jgi:SSS family solute:Na+ symporter